jgi:hypothetical protein
MKNRTALIIALVTLALDLPQAIVAVVLLLHRC